jgi:hypothetical protein
MNIYQRLAQVRTKVRHVARRQVSNVRFAGFSKYIGHDDVTAHLQQAYLEAGVHREASVLEWAREDKMLTVVVQVSWINIEDPTDRAVVRSIGESIIATSKGPSLSDKQAGIALSYACKIAELKCLCIVGDDTPDPETESPGAVDTTGPSEVPPELGEQLDAIQLAFVEGTRAAVDNAKALMREIAPRLPRRTIDEFRKLARDANERVRDE